MVPAKISSFAFHTSFFVRFRRRTELAVESPVRTKRDKPSCLFPPIALEDLLHGRRQVVVSEFAEDTMKEAEGQLMRLQKRLLCGVGEGAVERRSARHASHREHLQLRPLAGYIRVRLIPIHLGLYAPLITLRHERFVNQQAQSDLSLTNIQPDGPLTHLALGKLDTHSLPDAMRRVALLARRLPVRFQNPVYKCGRTRQLPAWTLGPLPRLR